MMDHAQDTDIPQEGTAASGQSLLLSTSRSSSVGSGGSSRVHGEKKGKTAKRSQRDAERLSAWQERRKKTGGKTSDQEAGPSTETSPNNTWARKLWIRGSTLFKKKRSGGEGDDHQAPPAEEEEEAAPVDPAAIYKGLEESCKLARLEELGNLSTALRHIIRLQHPKGAKICFPVPEAVDRLQLRCANLPTDPEDLSALVDKAYERRGESLDRDSLYKDFVMAHGRLAMDSQLPFPSCYYQTRHP